jgi:hypothetical protein
MTTLQRLQGGERPDLTKKLQIWYDDDMDIPPHRSVLAILIASIL